MKRESLFALCALPLPLFAAAPDDATVRKIVNAAVAPMIAQYDIPGMAIALTIKGKPYFLNHGVSSRRENKPVSEYTLFELGSVSKTLTATLGSYAQVRGKLSLSDHPGRYMAQLKGSGIDQATLLHLATYTAGGLPLQFPAGVASTGASYAISDYFPQWKPSAQPGEKRQYSNPSIGLFGHIAALALQRDFAVAIETKVLPQLGMGTTFVDVPQNAMGDYAWGYDQFNRATRVQQAAFGQEAYGMKSTSADMLRFVQENIDPSGLDDDMRRAVVGTQIGYFQVGAMVQGLGWEQYSYPVSLQTLLSGNSTGMATDAQGAKPIRAPRAPAGPTLFNKTGSTLGFASYVLFVPYKQIGLVMLANRAFSIEARIRTAYAILEALAP